jgi:hypothetical protein
MQHAGHRVQKRDQVIQPLKNAQVVHPSSKPRAHRLHLSQRVSRRLRRNDICSGFHCELPRALLRCARLGQARSLIPVGQIARVSSSKAAGTRTFTVSSTPSS